MNMTKKDLTDAIHKGTRYTKSDISMIVEMLLSRVGAELRAGNSIELRGFGTFSVKERKARPARNPRTGEQVMVPVRIVPLFRFKKGYLGKAK